MMIQFFKFDDDRKLKIGQKKKCSQHVALATIEK